MGGKTLRIKKGDSDPPYKRLGWSACPPKKRRKEYYE